MAVISSRFGLVPLLLAPVLFEWRLHQADIRFLGHRKDECWQPPEPLLGNTVQMSLWKYCFEHQEVNVQIIYHVECFDEGMA